MAADRQERAVFDCLVFLHVIPRSAARAESPAAACLSLAVAGVVRLFVSDQILRKSMTS